MKKARNAATGNRGGTKGSGYLGKDMYGREVPGFTTERSVGEMPARTGYTAGSHDRTRVRSGQSKKSTKISLPSG